MIRFASAVLLLAITGCTAAVPENAIEPATNATSNSVEIEANTVKVQPSPVVNEAAVNEATTEAAAGANGVPVEVQAFIERREGCEHWAGEPDWDNAERKKQIEDAVKDLCPGIDTQLAALRKRYTKDPKVVAALADFEPLGMEP